MILIKKEKITYIETHVINWMNKNGYSLLRISLGIIFLWFGFLKFFPGISPAQDLAINTIKTLSFGLLPDTLIINGLAVWEVVIGLGLLWGKYIKATLILLFLQMIGTFTPIFLFPHEVFTRIPYAFTIEGQYIVKNIVVVSAAIVLGGRISVKNMIK